MSVKSIVIAMIIGGYGAIIIDAWFLSPTAPYGPKSAEAHQLEVIPTVEASTTVAVTVAPTSTPEKIEDAPKTVKLVVVYSKEGIKKAIREAFPESPNTAVAIATCESGLKAVRQSDHILSYGRERSFGLFQIHAPVWHDDALRLGLPDYQTDVEQNIKMAQYIYNSAKGGPSFRPWTCFTNGDYWLHL